jgi:hypothetical protein
MCMQREGKGGRWVGVYIKIKNNSARLDLELELSLAISISQLNWFKLKLRTVLLTEKAWKCPYYPKFADTHIFGPSGVRALPLGVAAERSFHYIWYYFLLPSFSATYFSPRRVCPRVKNFVRSFKSEKKIRFEVRKKCLPTTPPPPVLDLKLWCIEAGNL